MGCIQFHTPLTPLHLHLKHKQPLRTTQLLWLSSNEPTELFHRPNNLSPLAPTPKALPSLLDLSASSAAKSGGDLSVLLPTSAVLFLLYFIANFLVPNFIFKSLQSDEASEDQKQNDDDDDDDDSI
ncbi:uncharacterized protein LOC133876363 [Alnus glutinosa]|uniref:uncharacterized protein LOC133876363 n=1 Tax=Alnus glutinosa TaxID=3517 RepID=UPI002D7746B2|nr:uncharacterized protein LOC133876363 [Alnus glutinosa]